jgi:hypothetical protein
MGISGRNDPSNCEMVLILGDGLFIFADAIAVKSTEKEAPTVDKAIFVVYKDDVNPSTLVAFINDDSLVIQETTTPSTTEVCTLYGLLNVLVCTQQAYLNIY